ncbi:unnamed protein product [Pleuronectes platessa]|uniref:Uncharacterized protein n=1 Tax=Pleuronectes platessa TaxID=8262 RepID=A0A9N7THZ2_PLEPL|nr:unnamed protein product [Pleuronectes platessa]
MSERCQLNGFSLLPLRLLTRQEPNGQISQTSPASRSGSPEPEMFCLELNGSDCLSLPREIKQDRVANKSSFLSTSPCGRDLKWLRGVTSSSAGFTSVEKRDRC